MGWGWSTGQIEPHTPRLGSGAWHCPVLALTPGLDSGAWHCPLLPSCAGTGLQGPSTTLSYAVHWDWPPQALHHSLAAPCMLRLGSGAWCFSSPALLAGIGWPIYGVGSVAPHWSSNLAVEERCHCRPAVRFPGPWRPWAR